MTDPTRNLLLTALRQDIETTDALLAHLLPQIVAMNDGITIATVYRLTRGGMILWASSKDVSDETLSYAQILVDSLFQQALDNGKTAHANNQTVTPLYGSGEAFALLKLEHTGDIDITSVESISNELSITLHSKQLQELLQQQVATTAQMNQAQSLPEIVGVIAQSFVDVGQYVTITLFEYDGMELLSASAVASANRENSYEQDDPVGLEMDYLQTVARELEAAGAFFVADTDVDNRLTKSDREWLRERRVKSIYNLPIRIQGMLEGFISIVDTQQPIALSPFEQQIFSNVAQQASAIIEKNRLLERTVASLAETATLYALSADLLQAQDLPEVLFALHIHLGTDERFATISEYEYDDDGQLTNIYTSYTVHEGEVRKVNIPWTDEVTPELAEEAREFARAYGSDIEIIRDVDEINETYPIVNLIKAMGIGSSITLPIYEDGKRLQQITLAWEQPNGFDDDLIQLMRTAQSQVQLVMKNRRLLQQTQASASRSTEQAQVLRRLNDLIISTNQNQDETSLLQRTAQVLVDITGADHVGIGIIDSDTNVNRLVAEHPDTGITGAIIEGQEAGIPAILRETKQPVFMLNNETDDRIDERSRAALLQTGAKSSYFMPMFDLDNRLIGSIGIDYFERLTRFDETTLDAAQTIISQVAINLQKIRLLDESQMQAQQMQRITEFSQSMVAAMGVDEILKAALRATHDILQADYVSIYLVDDAIELLRQVGEYWEEQFNISNPGILLDGTTNTITAKAWRTRELVIMSKAQDEWESKHPYLNQLENLVSTPMVSGGVLVGMIDMGLKRMTPLKQTEIAAFLQMSNQIAVAITNAVAFAQSQKLARNKAIANEIVAQMQRQTDVEDILMVTARELGKVLGAKRARIRLGVSTATGES